MSALAGLGNIQYQARKAAPAAEAAFYAKWYAAKPANPCHDIDPECLACPFQSFATCGSEVATAEGPPRYTCNMPYLSCQTGRVTLINFTSIDFVFYEIPDITPLKRLKHLHMEGVAIVTSQPTPYFTSLNDWASLPSLVSIRLGLNGTILAAAPTSWANLAALEHLLLTNITFNDGGLPDSWAQLGRLRTLALQDVVFGGANSTLPASWAALPRLANITLIRVSGLTHSPIANAWLTGFPSLAALRFDQVTRVTAPLSSYLTIASQPRTFMGNLSSGLVLLAVDNMNLTGTITADQLTPSRRCRSISLANNRVAGPIGGFNWTAMSSLQYLNLSGNLLSGSIPESWSAFRNQMSIDISNNNITGKLPAGLAAVGSDGLVLALASLNASNNQLTGSLPASWANLSSATPTALVLARNQLTGAIPDSFGSRIASASNMIMWTELDLSSNIGMCGPVPMWFLDKVTRGVPSAAVASLKGTQSGSLIELSIYECFTACNFSSILTH
eukprot:gene11529-11672_t